MTGRLRDCLPLAGGAWVVSFTTHTNPGQLFDTLKDQEISVEIKKASRGRSKTANDFCWALCSDIGKAMKPPLTKEEVYRTAIRAVGVYTPVTVVVWDLATIKRRWESHGVGWFGEVVDDAGTGKKLIHLYYGSSTYTVDEMRVLLDWLVDQAEQMEIPIPISKAEEERLLERWGKKSDTGAKGS